MAFNSNTYHANKARKAAYAWIAKAKEIKARAALGQAYDWEIARIPNLVSYARSDMRISRMFRSLNPIRV